MHNAQVYMSYENVLLIIAFSKMFACLFELKGAASREEYFVKYVLNNISTFYVNALLVINNFEFNIPFPADSTNSEKCIS